MAIVKNKFGIEGKRNGYWERYYSNGQLNFKGNYINGVKDGYWEEYYSNGQFNFKGNYINGVKDGYWEEYYGNGHGDFINIEQRDLLEECNKNDNLVKKRFYVNI